MSKLLTKAEALQYLRKKVEADKDASFSVLPVSRFEVKEVVDGLDSVQQHRYEARTSSDALTSDEQ